MATGNHAFALCSRYAAKNIKRQRLTNKTTFTTKCELV